MSIYPELSRLALWIQGDPIVKESLPWNRYFSHVIHAAADSTQSASISPLDRFKQIVLGTQNILDLSCSTQTSRFLFVSSGAVYGEQPINMEKIPESYCGMPDPLDCRSAYGIGKRTAEHLCALYRNMHQVNVVIARCFAFVGQDLPLAHHFAIGNFIRDALWEKEITVHGNGDQIRSYLDQRDLAIWLLTLLENGTNGCAYNVGSDEDISIARLAELVGSLLAPEKPIRYLRQATGSDRERRRYVPDIKLAKNELELKVSISLPDSIRHAGKMLTARKKF
jgi:dTDP-glucose 4,6-dehydratase